MNWYKRAMTFEEMERNLEEFVGIDNKLEKIKHNYINEVVKNDPNYYPFKKNVKNDPNPFKKTFKNPTLPVSPKPFPGPIMPITPKKQEPVIPTGSTVQSDLPVAPLASEEDIQRDIG